MLQELNDDGWQDAFGYAGEPNSSARLRIQATITHTQISTQPFTREDVVEIAGKSAGESSGPERMIYGRLKDGRWFYLEAGCNYIGLDFQASGSVIVGASREDIISMAMTDEARQRLGVNSKA